MLDGKPLFNKCIVYLESCQYLSVKLLIYRDFSVSIKGNIFSSNDNMGERSVAPAIIVNIIPADIRSRVKLN